MKTIIVIILLSILYYAYPPILFNDNIAYLIIGIAFGMDVSWLITKFKENEKRKD